LGGRRPTAIAPSSRSTRTFNRGLVSGRGTGSRLARWLGSLNGRDPGRGQEHCVAVRFGTTVRRGSSARSSFGGLTVAVRPRTPRFVMGHFPCRLALGWPDRARGGCQRIGPGLGPLDPPGLGAAGGRTVDTPPPVWPAVFWCLAPRRWSSLLGQGRGPAAGPRHGCRSRNARPPRRPAAPPRAASTGPDV